MKRIEPGTVVTINDSKSIIDGKPLEAIVVCHRPPFPTTGEHPEPVAVAVLGLGIIVALPTELAKVSPENVLAKIAGASGSFHNESAITEITSLRQSIAKLTDDREKLQAEVYALKNSVRTLSGMYDRSCTRVSDLTMERNDLADKNEGLRRQIDRDMETLTKMRERMEIHRGALVGVAEQEGHLMESRSMEVRTLENRVIELTKERNKLQSELATIRGVGGSGGPLFIKWSLAGWPDRRPEQLTEHENQLEDVRSAKNQADQKLKSCDSHIASLRDTIKSLQGALKIYQKSGVENITENRRLEETLQKVIQERDQLRRSSPAADLILIHNLKGQLAERDATIRTQSARIIELEVDLLFPEFESRLKQAEAMNDAWKATCETQKIGMDAALEQIKERDEKIDRLKENFKIMRESTEDAFKKFYDKNCETFVTLRKENADLMTALKAQNEANAKLGEQNARLLDAETAFAQKAKRLFDENLEKVTHDLEESWKTIFAAAERENQFLTKERDELRLTVKSLKTELDIRELRSSKLDESQKLLAKVTEDRDKCAQDAENAIERARRAEVSISRMNHRLQLACGGSMPSAGHDWIDEIIGLLRVAREQRDTQDHPYHPLAGGGKAIQQPGSNLDPVTRVCGPGRLTEEQAEANLKAADEERRDREKHRRLLRGEKINPTNQEEIDLLALKEPAICGVDDCKNLTPCPHHLPGPQKIMIVVNGNPFEEEFEISEKLNAIRAYSINKVGYGRSDPGATFAQNIPIGDWELRDSEGRVLDPELRLSQVNLKGRKLFVCLRPGVGG